MSEAAIAFLEAYQCGIRHAYKNRPKPVWCVTVNNNALPEFEGKTLMEAIEKAMNSIGYKPIPLESEIASTGDKPSFTPAAKTRRMLEEALKSVIDLSDRYKEIPDRPRMHKANQALHKLWELE